MKFLQSIDRNEATYWLGLFMLFVGLSLRVSVATGLTACGAIIAVTSAASSFFITWLSVREHK